MIRIDLCHLCITWLRTVIHLLILMLSVLTVNIHYHFNFSNTVNMWLLLAGLVGSLIITLINTDYNDQPVRWE